MKPGRKLIAATLIALASIQMQAATGVHTWAENSALSEGYWVKVALDEVHDGIFQINYAQLRNWGFNDPEKVGVYGFGGHEISESFASAHIDDVPELAVYHDSANKRILFYGRGLLEWTYKDANYGYTHRWNSYSEKACYFLHEKEEAPLAIDTTESSTFERKTLIDTFDHLLVHEKDNINLGETGRVYYGESFTQTRTQRFDMKPNNQTWGNMHTLNAGTARLTVNFVAYGDENSTISTTINGQDAGTATIKAVTTSYTFANQCTLNKVLADFGDLNSASVSITYNSSEASNKLARLNYIRLQGQSPLAASESEPYLLFRNHRDESIQVVFQISGLTQQMQVWDVTNPTHASQMMVNEEGKFAPQARGKHEYAIVNLANTNSFPGVSLVGTVEPQNLHGTPGANLVIVTAPGYMEQAMKLADYRNQHDSLSVLIVTPEQIYNEYASGNPDATAIRLFMKQMYDRQQNADLPASEQLRYLLLLGDGSFENKKNAQSNYKLLTYQSDGSLRESNSCTTDDYFGFLDDEEGGKVNDSGQYQVSADKMDIGIGRLPVSNTTDAETVVNKIIAYSENHYLGAWKNRHVFLADDDKNDYSGQDSPNLHIKHNEQLALALQNTGHHELIYQKIYLPAYQQTTSAAGTEYPDAKKEFLEALQQGSMVINYAGHGATGNITHENLMNTAQARDIRMKHLPLWILASCDVARWDASETSMGETLLLNANGGAIGVIGAARIVYASNNLVLHQGIVDHMFDRNTDGSRFRLGDMLKAAKQQMGTDFNKLNYALLGDPSMLLSMPEQKLVVDEVNYGEKVTISGHVLNPGTQETDTLFNGLIYPNIYGAADSITADKGLWQEPAYTFMSRTKKVFSGRDVVRNGRFSFSFALPVDVSTTNAGLVNLYACSEEGAEASGYYNRFTIAANEGDENDQSGPEIKALFLNSPAFVSGDCVGTTPFFYAEVHDESGFNTTGNSVGHDITLIVRCTSNTILKPQQYVLNNYFTTFTGDPTTGNVKYSLSQLEEGSYEATFRVWDANNNPTTQIFTFVVSESEVPQLDLVQAYPSPVKQGAEVTFRVMHNRPESAEELHLQIFTQMGVKVLDKTVASSASEVVYLNAEATEKTDISKALNADETSALMGCSTMTWSATVAPGVYMYRVFMKSDKGESTMKAKKLIVF